MPKGPLVGRLITYPASGGLETISIPGATTPGRVVDGGNFIVDITGTKRKFPGIERRIDDESVILSPLGYARGCFDYWRTSGNEKVQRTVVIADGNVWADTGNGTFVDVTSSIAITQTDNVSFETFFGLLVMTFDNNPSSVPVKFNGTTCSALGGTPPNARFMRTFYNRMFGGGDPAAPDTLYVSDADNPEDWVGGLADQINIDQGDQDPVGLTALFPPLYGRMVVAKQRSLYEVTPSSTTFAISQLSSGMGCLSHQTATMGDNDVYFVSERGIHSLLMTDKFGQVETAFLSYSIQNWFQENVSFRYAGNMRAIYAADINSYLLAVTTIGYSKNNVLLAYNFVLKEWSKRNVGVAGFMRYVDPRDALRTKIGLVDYDGRVGILDLRKSGRVTTWFGDLVTTNFATGIIYPVNSGVEVTFKKLTCLYRPQTEGSSFTVDYLVNGSLVDTIEFSMEPLSSALIGKAVIGVDFIGGSGQVRRVTRELKGVGHAIEMVFTHTPQTASEDFELYGYIIEYEYAGESDEPQIQ